MMEQMKWKTMDVAQEKKRKKGNFIASISLLGYLALLFLIVISILATNNQILDYRNIYNNNASSNNNNNRIVERNQDSTPDVLTVTTYNVFQGSTQGGRPNHSQVQYILRNLSSEVILLQESDNIHLPTANRDIVTFLNYPHSYYGLPGSTLTVGCALLGTAPYEMYNRSAAVMPHTSTFSLTRPMVEADVVFQNINIHVINVHVEFFVEEDHILQCDLILSKITSTQGPLIVGGDFNAFPDTYCIVNIKNAGMRSVIEEIHGEEQATYYNGEMIDYLFYRDLNVRNAFVSSEDKANYASDHYPVTAHFYI